MNKTQTIFSFVAISLASVLLGSTFADQMVIAQGTQVPVFDAKIKRVNQETIVISTVRVNNMPSIDEDINFTWEITASGQTSTPVSYTYPAGETGKIKIGDLETGQIIVKYDPVKDVLVGKYRIAGDFGITYDVSGFAEGALSQTNLISGQSTISATSQLVF
ncbi:hypothetical protein [Nitrosopumilus oxyclinae]|nr:hypothetical protein [Nitrosopumilus oxyclinae]